MIHVINGLEHISGAEIAMLRIAAYQKIRPLTIVSLTPIGNVAAISELPVDVDIVALNSRAGLFGSLVRLALFLRSRSPDTVVSWMYRANAVTALAMFCCPGRHSLVWNIRHSLYSLTKESWRVRTSILLNRALGRIPRRIVYVSERSLIQHEAYGLPPEKSLHIPNGFEVRFSESASRNEGGITIGHAGRLVWEKDPDTLLAAFARARSQVEGPVTLLMAGAGFNHGEKAFDDLLARYGLQDGSVRGLGKLSDMSAFYSRLDIFVLSSVSEGFPNVLAEALLAEVPCISTDVGDAAEIVSPESGWVVPPSDSEQLAKAMVRAIRLPVAERRAMGVFGRLKVLKNYAVSEISQRYDRLSRT